MTTSQLYNDLTTQLTELNKLIYQNINTLSDDECRSLCGSSYHLYVNLKTKCEHIERMSK